ncbi:MAG: alkaline phosphatase D family protein [Streptosporangiales bacterium]
MSVVNAMVGGVTDETGRVVATTDSSSASLLIDGRTIGPVSASNGAVSFDVVGLAADTPYAWTVDDGESSIDGELYTFGVEGEPWDFTFAYSSCAGLNPLHRAMSGPAPERVSDHPVFDDVRAAKPRININGGDWYYGDIGSGKHGLTSPDADTYRAMYDAVLATRQGELYRNVPFVQVWDDHDYGPGDSDRTAPNRADAAQVYRERMPSYNLPAADNGGIYHSFMAGRVQFVCLDTRYYRDPSSDAPPRTLLGSAQKTWLDGVLGSSEARLLAVVQSQRWNTTGHGTGLGSYADERDELVTMFGDHGWLGRMFMLSGDIHGSGISSGASNPFGGFPLFHGGSLDSTPSPYGNGHGMDVGWESARGQYLLIDIKDTAGWTRVSDVVWRS